MAQFETSLPDFVCNERITSSKISDGKVTSETVIESLFAGVQKKDEHGHMQYTETRDLVTLNGKKAAKGQKPKGPFLLHGGFSAVLSTTFDAQMAPYRTYNLVAAESLEGKTMLVIAFTTRPGQQEIGASFGRGSFLVEDTGKSWIDPECMQVARLERQIVNVPSSYRLWSMSVDYAQVPIGGKPFWMPKAVRSEIRRNASDTQPGRFVAEYTNYRKFEVSSGIVY